ncbi:MAG TPA: hypothetical protein PLS49_08385 [Candidatus Woesebacteria bacterium]|nr:hypothetical protein [Candidatus Woesebacteria bacterium]
MADFTPLDISSLQKKFERDGGLNTILIVLATSTIGVIGFILYLLFAKY